MTETVPLTGQLSPKQIQMLAGFHEKKPVALARAISMVEDERQGFQELLHELLKAGPETARLGFTGPPGAGKSSLVAATAARYRAREDSVGIVAVDPTSPYSGGALLGDRIRMNDLATDPGIFIRSMASRGSLGGLATTTKEVLDLMDMYRFDRLLIETVGVGQTELEITAAADTVVVVLVPESGDAIQAMKAGLMEIADIFVVNKADRPGADRLIKEIRQAMHLRVGSALKDVPAHHGVDLARIMKKERTETPSVSEDDWSVPVLATTAQTGDGVDELLEAVERHRSWLVSSGQLEERRRARAKGRVQDVVNRELRRITWRRPETTALLDVGLERIRTGDETPYSVAKDIIEGLVR